MRQHLLLTVTALLIALAYIWLMLVPRVFLFNLPQPDHVDLAVNVLIMIVEEWLMAGVNSLPFAIVIGVIFRRGWMHLAVSLSALHLALVVARDGGLTCGHLRWLSDCVQMYARDALVLPLLTWPVARIAAYCRAHAYASDH